MKHYFILIFFVMTSQFLNAQNTNDPYQWLEAVEDEKALNWVKNWNEKSLEAFSAHPEYLDDRVHPGHARKMVAKMNDMGYKIYYYENTEGGHAGASTNEQRAQLYAMIYTYLHMKLTGNETSQVF